MPIQAGYLRSQEDISFPDLGCRQNRELLYTIPSVRGVGQRTATGNLFPDIPSAEVADR